MPRIRTIDKGYQEYRETDPNTSLTKTALRRLIITHKIPSFMVGGKYLFDLDVLEAYLQGSIPRQETAPGIREIKL